MILGRPLVSVAIERRNGVAWLATARRRCVGFYDVWHTAIIEGTIRYEQKVMRGPLIDLIALELNPDACHAFQRNSALN